MDSNQISQVLERLGRTLSDGDLCGVSSCWAFPALFLSDDGVTLFEDADQIEKSFSQAIAWYRSQGLVSTKPELERVDMLTEKLAAVDVRWPAFDASGQERASERSHYLVQLANDGQVHVCVALTRTK